MDGCFYMFLLVKYGFHVGKYTSPMDPMGIEVAHHSQTPVASWTLYDLGLVFLNKNQPTKSKKSQAFAIGTIYKYLQMVHVPLLMCLPWSILILDCPDDIWIIFGDFRKTSAPHSHVVPGTPKPTIYKWMEMVISNHFLYEDLVHHPIETTIYKWLALGFQVQTNSQSATALHNSTPELAAIWSICAAKAKSCQGISGVKSCYKRIAFKGSKWHVWWYIYPHI